LTYLDSFKEQQYRFRTARRLLIGSAEDGHSIRVMEKVAEKFWRMSKSQADLVELSTAALYICKVPNWWHPDTGGPDYIHESLVGERAWLYKDWDQNVTTLQREIERAIEERNRAMAIGAVGAFAAVRPPFGSAERLGWPGQLAEKRATPAYPIDRPVG